MKYVYRAVTTKNVTITNEITSKNKKEAIKAINRDSKILYTISIHPKVPKVLEFMFKSVGVKKISREKLAGFFEQLGTMLSSGIDVSVALAGLAKFGQSGVKELAWRLREDIHQGKSLSQSFKANEKFIGGSYDNFISAGTAGTGIATVLLQLASDMQIRLDTSKKIKNAFIYPGFTFGVVTVLGWYIFTSVLPDIIAQIKEMSDAALPTLTVIVMSLVEFLQVYGIFVLSGMIIIAALSYWLVTKGPLINWFGAFKLRIPILGTLIQYRDMASFYRSFGIGISVGMPDDTAFKTAVTVVENRLIRKKLLGCADKMSSHGVSAAEALSECEFTDGLEVQALETGHKSATTPRMAIYCAKRLELEADSLLKKFTAMVDPLLLCVIGIVVGIVLFAVYSPIFSMMETMAV